MKGMQRVSFWPHLITAAVFVLVMAISARPLLAPEFFRVHDYTHAARIVEFLRAAQDGQLPVRWSAEFGFGYGMPLFLFYAPLPSAFGALVYWLTRNMHLALTLLFFLPSVVTFWGGYFLGKKWFGWQGGLVAAVIMTLAPYRALNLYVRGAISEVWGMMTFPWLLWAASEVLDGHWKKWWQVVAWALVLFLSHNLSTMMFVPLLGIWSLGYWVIQNWAELRAGKWHASIRPLTVLIASGVLSVGLATFYWLPALVEKNATKVDRIFGGYFHYSQHFLYIRQFFQDDWGYGGSGWGPDDDISFFLGYAELALFALAVAGLGVFLGRWFTQKSARRELDPTGWAITLVSLGCLGIALFFTLGRSEVIWQNIGILQTIQFPWRWLGAAVIFLGLVGAASISVIPSQWRAMGLGLVIGVVLLNNQRYFSPEFFLNDFNALYYTDPQRIAAEMSPVLNDYIPQGFPEEGIQPPLSTATTEPPLAEADFEVLKDVSHQKIARLKTTVPVNLTWQVAAFPGWQTYVNTQPTQSATTTAGLIQTQVPAGEHFVSLVFERTPIRRIADGVTLLSLFILVATYWRTQFYAHTPQK
jgi:hypothetical protein